MAWNADEDGRLLEAYERGDSHREIAEALGRSRQSVGYRLNLLGRHRRPSRRGDDVARFWSYVEKHDADCPCCLGCWIWRGPRFADGYGMIAVWPRTFRVTRFAYSTIYGRTLRADAVVMHSCDRPLCVNPDHLIAGNQLDNEADKVAKGRQSRLDRHGMARYSNEQIREVVRLLRSGTPRREIAAATGVRMTTVDTVARGRQWRGVMEAA